MELDLADYIGETAILFGIAENAATGAVIRCGTTSHVYVDGLSRWEHGEQHAAFEITGILVEEGSDADLNTDQESAVHGIGKHYVMKNATWERIP
jgi:hypothetical protein